MSEAQHVLCIVTAHGSSAPDHLLELWIIPSETKGTTFKAMGILYHRSASATPQQLPQSTVFP
jgi:hypothetical protein